VPPGRSDFGAHFPLPTPSLPLDGACRPSSERSARPRKPERSTRVERERTRLRVHLGSRRRILRRAALAKNGPASDPDRRALARRACSSQRLTGNLRSPYRSGSPGPSGVSTRPSCEPAAEPRSRASPCTAFATTRSLSGFAPGYATTARYVHLKSAAESSALATTDIGLLASTRDAQQHAQEPPARAEAPT
jgi:hypothetical protein